MADGPSPPAAPARPCCLLPPPVLPWPGPLPLPAFVVGASPTRPGARAVTPVHPPCGMPAREARSARARVDRGVSPAGFTTKVQPAASVGPALRVIIALGKFHGVIDAATPIGCFITMMRLSR